MTINSVVNSQVNRIRRVLHRNSDIAILGRTSDPQSDVAVSGSPGYWWVRKMQAGHTYGPPSKVRGCTIPIDMTPGTPVMMGEIEGEDAVLGPDFAGALARNLNPLKSAVQDPNANNPLFVNQQMITTGFPQVVEGTLKVAIRGWLVLDPEDVTWRKFEKQSPDLTIPAAGLHCAAVISVLRDYSDIEIQYSTSKDVAIQLDVDDLNEAWGLMSDPTNTPMGSFDVGNGITQLTDANRWLDIRQLWSLIGTVGTVTSVSWVTHDGVSASITTPSTGVIITPSLGAITPNSSAAKGTAGAGFYEDVAQSVDPAAPAVTGVRMFADASGYPAFRVKNGSDTFTRLFAGVLTAKRTYALPDASGTVALTSATGQGYVMTAPTVSTDNVVSAATATIRALALKTTDDNTTTKLLEFLSSANAVTASVGATGLAVFAGINSTPIGATTPAAVTATVLAADIIKQTSPANTTLSSDSFTFSKSYHILTPQTGFIDNLSTINGGTQGDILVIQAAAGQIITLLPGVGNILSNTQAASQTISADICYLLYYNGSNWVDFFPPKIVANVITSGTLSGVTVVVRDGTFTIQNSSTSSKQAQFDLSPITASTTRTYSLPDANGTIALTNTVGQGFVVTAPAASANNVVSAATTTIRTLALKTTDNNTTNNLLEFLSSANAVLAHVGATGLAAFAGIDSTPIGATTPAAVTATTYAMSSTLSAGTQAVLFSPAMSNLSSFQGMYQFGGTLQQATNVPAIFSVNAIIKPTTNLSQIIGVLFIPQISDLSGTSKNVTVTQAFLGRVDTAASYAGTITAVYDFYAANSSKAGGTISNQFGFYAEDMTSGAANYAIFTNKGLVSHGDQVSVTGSQDVVQVVVTGNGTQTNPLQTWNTSTPTVVATISGIGVATFDPIDSATNTILYLTSGHESSGTPAANFGAGYKAQAKDSTTAAQTLLTLDSYWTTATHASRTSQTDLKAYDTAARTAISIAANGSVAQLGFYGTTPVSKQTDGAALTNNVTSGGTTDTIANFTSLSVYATDAATIRNDIFQLARKIKIVDDAMRAYGLLT